MGNCPLLTDTLHWLRGLFADLRRRKSLTYLFVSAGVVTFAAGVGFYLVDPAIKSPLDGMWYAWVTMTHVGYGDVVATSFLGRALAALVILFGIALLALCTATISAAIISRDTDQIERDVRHLEKQSGSIKAEENQILLELARIQKKLAQIEEQMKTQEKPRPRRS